LPVASHANCIASGIETPLTAALGTATRDGLVPMRQIPGFRIDDRVIDETRDALK
jgi:hypothetical protein